jgi:hypothetical protein
MVILCFDQIETDGTRFGALSTNAVASRLLGILRRQGLELGLGVRVFEMRRPGAVKIAANSAQALEAVISTIRTASSRGLGGSIPNSCGCSLSTQRQNFRIHRKKNSVRVISPGSRSSSSNVTNTEPCKKRSQISFAWSVTSAGHGRGSSVRFANS